MDLGVQTRAWPEVKEPRQAKLEAKGRELVAELPAHNDMRHDRGYAPNHSTFGPKQADMAYRKAQEDLKTRTPAILTPERALPSIVEAGRFKNQHETGTSGGMNDPQYRRDFEERHFNYPKGVPGDALPVYGYMASTRNSTTRGEASTRRQYGNAEVILKPGIKARTSLTHADSLGGHRDAVPYHDVVSGKADAERYTGGSPETSYTEAQYHGGVRLSDIERIDIHDAGYGHDSASYIPSSPRGALQEAGIPYRSMEQGRTYTQGSFISRSNGRSVLGGTPTGDRRADELVDEDRFSHYSLAQERIELWASEQWAPGMAKPIKRGPITQPKVDTFISQSRSAVGRGRTKVEVHDENGDWVPMEV